VSPAAYRALETPSPSVSILCMSMIDWADFVEWCESRVWRVVKTWAWTTRNSGLKTAVEKK
jgi:hypothetical protein